MKWDEVEEGTWTLPGFVIHRSSLCVTRKGFRYIKWLGLSVPWHRARLPAMSREAVPGGTFPHPELKNEPTQGGRANDGSRPNSRLCQRDHRRAVGLQRLKGAGPPPASFWGRRPLYRPDDVLPWAQSRMKKKRA